MLSALRNFEYLNTSIIADKLAVLRLFDVSIHTVTKEDR